MSYIGRPVSVIKDNGHFAGLAFDEPGQQFDLRNLLYQRHPGVDGASQVVVRTADGQLHRIGSQSGNPARLYRASRHGFPVECPDVVLTVDKASEALETTAPVKELVSAHSTLRANKAVLELSALFVEWELPEAHPRLGWNTSSKGVPVDVAIPGNPRAHGLGLLFTKDDQFAAIRDLAVPGARTYITTASDNHYLIEAGANRMATIVDVRTVNELGESKGVLLGGDAASGVLVVGKGFKYSAGNTSRVREILVVKGVTGDHGSVLDHGALMNYDSPAIRSIHHAIDSASLGAARP